VDFGLVEVLAAAGILFAASVVRGYSGFAFSAVLVAGLAFFVDPLVAVPLAIGLEVLASIVQAPSVRGDIDWQRLGVLVAAAVVGNPIGVLIVTGVDADPIRAFTFVTLAVLTVSLLAGKTAPIPATLSAFFVVGVIAGVVNGATALSGLVLVLAMTSMQVAPAEMRGTLVAYFFASDIIAIGVFWVRGELDAVFAWRILFAIPIMIAGVLIGSRAFVGTSVESFKRRTLTLLLVISIVGIARLIVG